MPTATPCVLFPLHHEAYPFLRKFRLRSDPGSPNPTWRTLHPFEIRIAVVGDLAHGVGSLLDYLASQSRVSCVVLAGFAGSLAEGLGVGDLLFAREGVDEQGRAWQATFTSIGDLSIPKVRLFTSTRMIGEPAQKRRLGQELDVQAVDMEASFVAHACSERGLPFACLRSISDDIDTALSPGLFDCLSAGSVSILRVLKLLMRRPGTLAEIWRLKRATDLARRNLAKALFEILTHHAKTAKLDR